MELYQLKTFIAVAEEQHLTRAAARLHISQPSVSTHIKAFEEELGLSLFIRTPKGMTLSPEGRIIKKKVESALQAAEEVRQQAEELKCDLAGEAHIGLNIDAHYLRIPDLLSVMQRNYPKLELHFFQRHSLEVPDQIRNGQLDAAFVFVTPTQSDFETKWLATMGIVIVAPYQWKKRLQNVELEDLAEFPWIWTDHRCPFNQLTAQLFGPLSRMPAKAVVVDQDTTIRKMVASGAGLCLMVEAEAREAAQHKDVVIIGDQVASMDLSILYLKKRNNAPLIQAIINGLCKVWEHSPSNDMLLSVSKNMESKI